MEEHRGDPLPEPRIFPRRNCWPSRQRFLSNPKAKAKAKVKARARAKASDPRLRLWVFALSSPKVASALAVTHASTLTREMGGDLHLLLVPPKGAGANLNSLAVSLQPETACTATSVGASMCSPGKVVLPQGAAEAAEEGVVVIRQEAEDEEPRRLVPVLSLWSLYQQLRPL